MKIETRADFEKIPLEAGVSFAFREFLLPHFETSWHFHPEVELTYILESTGHRFVGDSLENFGPGDLVLVGANLPHFWTNDTSTQSDRLAHSLVIQFKEDFARGVFDLPDLKPVRALLQKAACGLKFEGRVRSAVAKKIKDMKEQDAARRFTSLLLILVELAHSDEYRELCTQGFEPVLDIYSSERINRTYAYIIDNLNEEIRLDAAAACAGMSPSSFSRYFKKVMGKTFSAFVNELRIGRVCRDLLESDRSVAEIAFSHGYNNLSNFNRRFQEIMKTNPQTFRGQRKTN